VIVGGNVQGYDQTLASSVLQEVNSASYADAVAIGIILMALILALLGVLTWLQQREGGIGLRFRTAT
jgi:ABC-type tungstate transport system substrate-binding protein